MSNLCPPGTKSLTNSKQNTVIRSSSSKSMEPKIASRAADMRFKASQASLCSSLAPSEMNGRLGSHTNATTLVWSDGFKDWLPNLTSSLSHLCQQQVQQVKRLKICTKTTIWMRPFLWLQDSPMRHSSNSKWKRISACRRPSNRCSFSNRTRPTRLRPSATTWLQSWSPRKEFKCS